MKKLKNFEIENLVKAGILAITTNTISSESAYTVFKFKKAVKAANAALEESRRDAVKEAGIEDAPAFDKRRAELAEVKNPTSEQSEELAALNAKYNKFAELTNRIYNEEVEVRVSKPLSYDVWHTLQVENANTRLGNILSPYAEELLENILWAEPEEGYSGE